MSIKVGCFIDSDDPGGAETILINICRQLRLSGYLPEIYHFGNPWLESKCQEYNIDEIKLPGGRFYKSSFTLPIFFIIFALFLKRRKITMLHSHLFDAVVAAGFTSVIAGIPHVGTLHDIFSFQDNSFRARVLSLLTRIGTHLVVVSEQMNVHLNELCNFPEGGVLTVKNGVEIEHFSTSDKDELRKKYNYDAEKTILVSVGRLVDIKAHDILIEAFSFLTREYDDLLLLIVGDGPKFLQYKELIETLNLREKVHLLGHRDDIPNLLSLGDCYVMSSRSEGLSCSIIEAMASSLPIVATNVGGNYELVRNDINGFLTNVDDPEDLARKILILLKDRERIKKFGLASLEIANAEFSIESTLISYKTLYDECINS